MTWKSLGFNDESTNSLLALVGSHRLPGITTDHHQHIQSRYQLRILITFYGGFRTPSSNKQPRHFHQQPLKKNIFITYNQLKPTNTSTKWLPPSYFTQLKAIQWFATTEPRGLPQQLCYLQALPRSRSVHQPQLLLAILVEGELATDQLQVASPKHLASWPSMKPLGWWRMMADDGWSYKHVQANDLFVYLRRNIDYIYIYMYTCCEWCLEKMIVISFAIMDRWIINNAQKEG